MKSRSIKTSTGIFALAIITQILLVLGTFSIHYLLDNSTEELKTIQDVEQEFYKALFMENSTSSPVAKQSKDTQGQYEKIRSLMTSPLVHMTEQLISQRSQIFSQLTELRAKVRISTPRSSPCCPTWPRVSSISTPTILPT